MAQNCPLGFGIDISCRLDCSQWHRHFGYCIQQYDSWEEAETASVTKHLASASTTPVYPMLDRVKAELTHISNKLNEHLDKPRVIKPRRGGFVIHDDA